MNATLRTYDVYRSEGGYRVARQIVNGGPVTTSSRWYATKAAAQCAANNMRRAAHGTMNRAETSPYYLTPRSWSSDGSRHLATFADIERTYQSWHDDVGLNSLEDAVASCDYLGDMTRPEAVNSALDLDPENFAE